jgi:flagellar hook protein FlgE
MLASFSTALSALTADETAINVVGNNLANLNTPGFKDTVVSFSDLVTQSYGAGDGESQVGGGVAAPVTLNQFSQGAIQATAGPLDAAIQGDGFFIVQGAQGATEYTRGGNFQVNSSGTLETSTGEAVQGWTAAGGTLVTSGPTGNITVPTGTLTAPIATTATSVNLNLNATATAANGSFSTSVTVDDSLGTTHIVTYTFTPTGTPNQWNYSATIPAADATTVTPATGTLTFDSNGNLISPLPTDPQPVITATGMTDGSSDMNITWNLYNGPNNTTPTVTQFAQTSATSAVTQNGQASANLSSVSLGNGGQVIALYSNGQQVVVGQMAMASIRNPDSLIGAGDNNYLASGATALPAIGLPGTGGRGTVLGQSVESSTVDMATEFTNLIVFQRSYEANAHVVTTVDQMSQDTIALKP